MKCLIVFDGPVNASVLRRTIGDLRAAEINLLSFANDFAILKDAEKIFRTACSSVRALDAVQLLEGEIAVLREGISQWSSRIGDCYVGKKTVKEHFVLSGHEVSSWWFSLISDKNTLQTDIFLKIAQVNVVRRALEAGSYGRCIIICSDTRFRKAIRDIAVMKGVSAQVVPMFRIRLGRELFDYALGRVGMPGDFVRALSHAVRILLRHSIARLHLGSIRDRLPELGSALFVTYFPQVDKLEAEKGVFRNKYALALQDKAAMLRIPVTWLLMFEPLDGYDFKASVRLAAVFARHGEKVLMLEEFFTLKNFFMCVASWVREVLVAGYLLGRIDKKVLLAEPVGEENTALVRALWRKSFYGSRGIGGLIYYYMFRSMFREIRDTHDCVYYCEMQPWEKALNAARRVNPGRFRTIGFQHSSFSKNYFHYFYDKTELAGRGDATDLPLPDVMSCNGERAYAMFTGSGYRNVRKAESVRYLYLDTALSSDQSRARDDRPVLLVAGSVNREESLRLIRLTHEAFSKRDDGFEIWFKSHPGMPMANLFSELGIDAAAAGYLLPESDIAHCLERVRATLVPMGTVAIEALAFGCEVIIPFFTDSMPMNPLADFKEYYHGVRSPDELRSVVREIMSGYSLQSADVYKEFVRQYWYLDKELPRWEEILAPKI